MNLTAKIRGIAASSRQHTKRAHNAARRGVAAVEFALTLPIWITILLGTGDGTYFLLANEKTDRIAYSVTDIVSQYQTVNKANLADIVQAASQIMQPLPFGANGIVMISSVYKPAGATPKICWQYTGGGTLATQSASNPGGAASKIGKGNSVTDCSTGVAANLPNGLVLNDNDNVIISEVFYNFTPLFVSDTMFSSERIYRVAVYKPRLSPLVTPPT